MNKVAVLCGMSVVCLCGPTIRAEDSEEAPASVVNRHLPRWLTIGGEFRGRAEVSKSLDEDESGPIYLNRLRLNVAIRPTSWMRFYVQGQDARIFSRESEYDPDSFRDTFDLRQAYVQLGSGERGWQFAIGRQEISVGDERLVGADSYWDSFGQSFDAIRAGYGRGRVRVDAFAGFRVAPSQRHIDQHDRAHRMAGLVGQWKAGSGAVVEPYLLWRRGGETFDLVHHAGHRDVLTPGIRLQGDLPRAMDYNIEMAFQRGHVVKDDVGAWAAHWEMGWKPLGRDVGPRISVEFNFASGDRDPGDGKHRTFDDFYPAGYNKYGMPDPFAWRNIRYPALNAEFPITRRLSVVTGYRHFRLASRYDGAYMGGDDYLVRNPEAGSSVLGSQALAAVAYQRSPRWKIYGGYGHLFTGGYLRESGYGGSLRSAYVLTSVSF